MIRSAGEFYRFSLHPHHFAQLLFEDLIRIVQGKIERPAVYVDTLRQMGN